MLASFQPTPRLLLPCTVTGDGWRLEEGSNDKVGYFGSDPGITVEVPAGSIVAFTSLNFHSSGTNTTNRMRRVYLAQYSPEPIRSADGSKLWGNAEPLLLNGVLSAGSNAPEIAP